MDLKERVRESINSLDLPVKCLLGYLDGKHSPELRLQMLPGSTVIDEDYAGNKTETYAMEVIMAGPNEGLINETLGKIAELLADHDYTVISKDDSFDFSGVEVASFPHPILADAQGDVTYVFDFKVTVDTFNEKG